MAKRALALVENNTPIHLIWDDILMLPLYGVIDSKRGQEVMESVLDKILQTQSKVIIIDILSIATVDSAVANHLIKITQATKLMGAECIISGISPAIAQTLVALGVELSGVTTRSTLKSALEKALELLKLTVQVDDQKSS
jgi:rsbT co-antagonist protein RsbR